MRVMLLADILSNHTEKWAKGLCSRGIKVGIFSFNKAKENWYDGIPNLEILYQPKDGEVKNKYSNKIRYIRSFFYVRRVARNFKPDILHAHYASSYGFLGAFAGVRPLVISAWGTDVMKFPYESFIKKMIIKYSLNKAQAICATSNVLKEYVNLLVKKNVWVIPFGIDTTLFYPDFSKRSKDKFVFGSLKALERIYNQHILIEAFASLVMKYPNIYLILVGDGSQRNQLVALCRKLGVSDRVEFTGRVLWVDACHHLNRMNCLVNISEYESFGVSVIEAMGCKVPVVLTNTGGLAEVAGKGEYALAIEKPDVEKTKEAMENMLLNKEERDDKAQKAYEHVLSRYSWQKNLEEQINLYNLLLKKEK